MSWQNRVETLVPCSTQVLRSPENFKRWAKELRLQPDSFEHMCKQVHHCFVTNPPRVLRSLASEAFLKQQGYRMLKQLYRRVPNHLWLAEHPWYGKCVLKLSSVFEPSPVTDCLHVAFAHSLFSEADCLMRLQSDQLLHARNVFMTPEPRSPKDDKHFVHVGAFTFVLPLAMYNLGEMIFHHALEAHSVIPVVFHMSLAVHTLHTQNILHLDLKPENFLVFEDGNVRLSDFGLSIRKVLPESPIDCQRQTCMYRAPEMVMAGLRGPGLIHGIGRSTDVFSLGFCALTLLLKRPFMACILPSATRNSPRQFGEENRLLYAFMQCHLRPIYFPTDPQLTNSFCSCTPHNLTCLREVIARCPLQEWSRLAEALPLRTLCDLLTWIERCVHWDPSQRWSVEEAMRDPVFKAFHKYDVQIPPSIPLEDAHMQWRRSNTDATYVRRVLQHTLDALQHQHEDFQTDVPAFVPFNPLHYLDTLVLVSELYWRVVYEMQLRQMSMDNNLAIYWACYSLGFLLTRPFFDLEIFVSIFRQKLETLQTWHSFICSVLHFRLYTDNWLTERVRQHPTWRPTSLQAFLSECVRYHFGGSSSLRHPTTSP